MFHNAIWIIEGMTKLHSDHRVERYGDEEGINKIGSYARYAHTRVIEFASYYALNANRNNLSLCETSCYFDYGTRRLYFLLR